MSGVNHVAIRVSDHHRQALLHDSIEATPHLGFEPRDAARSSDEDPRHC